MINKIIAFSIRNKFIVGLFIAALIGVGSYSMYTINLGVQPDITNNQVQVITVSQNLATEDIEQFITYPVELAMSNLPGVKEVRSISRFGLSVVTIVFEDDMGTYLPRQLVSQKLSQVKEAIPDQFGSPNMGPISTGLGEIFQYTIQPKEGYEDQYTLTELRTIQDWIVARQMALTEGVVAVNAFGGYIKQYEIAIDPAKLNAMNVTMAEVFEALKRNNVNTGGAYIERHNQANFIRGKGLVHSIEDLQKIPVKTVGGIPILIEDVAEHVGYGHQVRYGAFTKDGHEAVGGMVMMLRGANPNTVIEHVKDKMKEVEESLPEGLTIKPFLDRSELIDRTTDTIEKNLIEGALIVIFVLVLLLGSLRGGLVTASLIPLSLLFAFVLMKIFGVWANLMSLGAIDFGIIVDGAVIIVEGTVHKIEKHIRKKREQLVNFSMDDLVYDAASGVMNSAFFGQIIILIVFTPILFLTGVEGKMFRPMAFTFGFAVLGAIILCLTYVPAVTALVMKPAIGRKNWFYRLEDHMHHFSEKMMKKIHNAYRPVILGCLKHRLLILIAALLLLAGGGYTFSKMGGEFIPSIDEGDIAMQVMLRPGSSLSQAIETTTRIEKMILANFPEVKTMVSRIGVADIPTDPMPMDIADTFIILEKDKDQWVSADNKKELIEEIKEKLSVIPGINLVFSQPLELRFNELLTGVRQDLAVKLYGPNLSVLAEKGEQMKKIIQSVPGASDVTLEATSGLPQITVDYNRQKVAQYGLDIAKLNNYVSMAFAGKQAGVIFEGERRFALVVRLDKAHRGSIEDLKNLLIDLPGGTQIPIKEVAKISYQPGPMQISRENTSRRIYVGVNVRDRDVESLVEAIQKKIDAQLSLPAGYHIDYGGAYENLERAKARLAIVVPIAMALIFILLYFALNSISESIMIYVAVPLAAVGGVFALAIRGMPFSISAGVGFIVLFGVAVLNGLVLISRLNTLKKEGVDKVKKRILIGTQERLRPILLTALAAIAGFMPMALSTSPGATVQRPLATVVIGGLISATLLTLIVVPILYSYIENRTTQKSQNKKRLNTTVIIALLTMGLLGVSQNVNAQSLPRDQHLPELTLQAAVKKAKASYPKLQAAQLRINQQKKRKKTAWDLGTTEISVSAEELPNGFNLDQGVTTLSISQNEIDVFGIHPKNVLQKQKITLDKIAYNLTAEQIERQVQLAWSKVYTTRGKYQLYVKLDSIFKNFKRAAKLRYQTAASSKLDYLTAKNQVHRVALNKKQAYRDYQASLQSFNRWFISDTLFGISTQQIDLITQPIMKFADSIASHPLLRYKHQQIEVAEANYKVQKSAFLPKLNLEYGRQKIAGVSGFNRFQIGISIPLIFNKKLGETQSAKVATQIAEQEYQTAKLEMNAKYNQLRQNYQKWLESWQFYQQEALPLAQTQGKGALFAFKHGSIDYTDFLQTIRDAIKVEVDSWEALNQYLQAKYELLFFLNSPQF